MALKLTAHSSRPARLNDGQRASVHSTVNSRIDKYLLYGLELILSIILLECKVYVFHGTSSIAIIGLKVKIASLIRSHMHTTQAIDDNSTRVEK